MHDAHLVRPAAWLEGPRCAATGRRLRVEFHHPVDRFAHSVVLLGADGERVPLLESVEGNGDEPWPPSPALRYLNHDQLTAAAESGASPAAALVGMSGASHWSLGIESAATSSLGLVFDAACRIKKPGPPVTSTYRLWPGVEIDTHDERQAVISCAGLRIAFELGKNAGWLLNSPQRHLTVVCQASVPSMLPATLRWRYKIAIADATQPSQQC